MTAPSQKTSGAGWLFGLGAFMIIFMALLPIASMVSDMRFAHSPEPSLPPGVPADTPVLYGTIKSDQPAYLICYGQDTDIKVEFGEHSSFKGLWSGSNNTFQINSPYCQDLTATTHSESWGNVLVSNAPGRTYTPWLSSALFVDKEYYHQWLSAFASLDVTRPVSSTLTFKDSTYHLEREIRFFVVSEEEKESVANHGSWEEAVKTNSGFWAVGQFSFPLMFLLLGIFLIIMGVIQIRAR